MRPAAFACLLLLAAPALAQSDAFDLRPGGIVGGGGVSGGGSFTLEGTIGQPDAAQSRGGGFRLRGGFWPASFEVADLPCAGDCGGDGRVTVDELVTLVAISVADEPPAECESGDGNGDGRVSVDELIAAVQRALEKCS